MPLSALGLRSVLGCLDELNQGDHFFLRSLLEAPFPLLLGQSRPQITFHGEVWLPASNGPGAGAVASLNLTVGKGNLAAKSRTSEL